MSASHYSASGVRGQGDALSAVLRHLGPTLSLPEGADVVTGFGGYASVIRVTDELAIALSTDGVGSKTIVAAMVARYDTIGFDCVAMNVNDVLCVGARPVAMVDYLGVNTLDAARTEEVLRGLGAAAKEAQIAIPGGELAQLPEVIGPSPEAFDLVGTCIGTVGVDRIVTGAGISPGDALIGIASSGIHSNGLTLARRVLFENWGIDDRPPGLARSLGEELLEPTAIYVRAITALWDAGIDTPGLAHITSDGFANLCRLEAPVGYRVDRLPSRPAIFSLVQEAGAVAETEMFRVFNMGIGFVVVVHPSDAEGARRLIATSGYDAITLGEVTDEAGVVTIEPAGLRGGMRGGESYFEVV